VVNAIDVMRLIDLLADLDTPCAAELRAFADRALVQVQTSGLRIGVATEAGRPIGEVLALIDAMGVKRDVWSMSSIDRPTGVDAWVVIAGGDEDRAREDRFLSRISEMEKVVVQPGARDLTGLAETIERWQAQCDVIRNGVIASHARPAIESMARDRSSLDDRLRKLPDTAEAVGAVDAFEKRSQLAMDALHTASSEAVEEIRAEVERCFSDWVEAVIAEHGDRPAKDRVEHSLEKWLRDRFAKSFAERLSRRVGTHADHLPQLRAALSALAQSQATDFAAPQVDMPERAEPSALRWVLPIAGGGVGYWRGGWRIGLFGAALGMVIARVLKLRAKRPLSSKVLQTAAANHVAAHLEGVMQRMLASLRHDCELECERLKEAVRAAEATKPERERLNATLEQLAKAKALLKV
jgi:hypothetical protein